MYIHLPQHLRPSGHANALSPRPFQHFFIQTCSTTLYRVYVYCVILYGNKYIIDGGKTKRYANKIATVEDAMQTENENAADESMIMRRSTARP